MSLSFDEEEENNRVRLNSLDDTLDGFIFEEKDFVETALLPDEDSDSEGRLPQKGIKAQSAETSNEPVLQDHDNYNSKDISIYNKLKFKSMQEVARID